MILIVRCPYCDVAHHVDPDVVCRIPHRSGVLEHRKCGVCSSRFDVCVSTKRKGKSKQHSKEIAS